MYNAESFVAGIVCEIADPASDTVDELVAETRAVCLTAADWGDPDGVLVHAEEGTLDIRIEPEAGWLLDSPRAALEAIIRHLVAHDQVSRIITAWAELEDFDNPWQEHLTWINGALYSSVDGAPSGEPLDPDAEQVDVVTRNNVRAWLVDNGATDRDLAMFNLARQVADDENDGLFKAADLGALLSAPAEDKNRG
jgi:hypothetical protein